MSDARIIVASLGYFIIAATLLGISGIAASSITYPRGSPTQESTSEPNETATTQTWQAAITECSISLVTSLFGDNVDCSRQTTTSNVFQAVTNVFGWAQSAFSFLFQLLTFSLPEVPGYLTAIIVVPPAIGLGYIGLKLIRG